MRWLAAGAMLALVAGAALPAEAAAKPKLVKKVRARRPMHAVAPIPPAPPAISPAIWEAPTAATDGRWLDDADALMTAIGDSAPDLTFEQERTPGYAWQLADGALVIAEPMGPGDTRFYFFDADMTAPFLVRDRLYSYGFDHGRLSAVYDGRGEPVRWDAESWQEGAAADLYARGRRLWFAARTPPRMALPAPKRPILLNIVADLSRWRDGDGWRGHRRGGYGRERPGARYGRANDGSPPGFGDVAQQPSDHRARRREQRGHEPGGLPAPIEGVAPVAFAPGSEPGVVHPDRAAENRPRRERGDGGNQAEPIASTSNGMQRPTPAAPAASASVSDARPVPSASEVVPAPAREQRLANIEEGAKPERAREERRRDPDAVERPD